MHWILGELLVALCAGWPILAGLFGRIARKNREWDGMHA